MAIVERDDTRARDEQVVTETLSLVRAAQRGSVTARDSLVERLHGDLLVKSGRLISSRRNVGALVPDDLAADTWARVFEKELIDRFEPTGRGAFRRFLTGIARNVLRERTRRRTERVDLATEVVATPIDEIAARAVTPTSPARYRDLVRRCRTLLVERCSEFHAVVWERWSAEGLSDVDLAAQFHRSRSRIRTVLAESRATLALALRCSDEGR